MDLAKFAKGALSTFYHHIIKYIISIAFVFWISECSIVFKNPDRWSYIYFKLYGFAISILYTLEAMTRWLDQFMTTSWHGNCFRTTPGGTLQLKFAILHLQRLHFRVHFYSLCPVTSLIDPTHKPCINIETVFSGMKIPILKSRQSWHSLIFTMGIPIRERRYLYVATGTWSLEKMHLPTHSILQ